MKLGRLIYLLLTTRHRYGDESLKRKIRSRRRFYESRPYALGSQRCFPSNLRWAVTKQAASCPSRCPAFIRVGELGKNNLLLRSFKNFFVVLSTSQEDSNFASAAATFVATLSKRPPGVSVVFPFLSFLNKLQPVVVLLNYLLIFPSLNYKHYTTTP